MRKRWINQWEDLSFSFWGRIKDIGRIQIKGSQIMVEFGKLHFSSLLLLVILQENHSFATDFSVANP